MKTLMRSVVKITHLDWNLCAPSSHPSLLPRLCRLVECFHEYVIALKYEAALLSDVETKVVFVPRSCLIGLFVVRLAGSAQPVYIRTSECGSFCLISVWMIGQIGCA